MSIFVRPDSPPPRAPSPEFTLASLPCPPPPRRVHSQPKIRVHSPASLHPPTKRLHGARSYDVIKHRQAADSDDGHSVPSPTTTSSSPIPSLYDSSTKRSVSVAPSSSSSTPRTGSPPPAQSSASSFVFPVSKHFTVDQPAQPVPVTIPTLKSKPSKASLPPLERHKNMGVACLRFFGVRFPSTTKSPRPPSAAV